jgi:hypothetical protein
MAVVLAARSACIGFRNGLEPARDPRPHRYLPGGADLPIYLRVTQADGHQAWSSPIYLIA